MSVFKTEFEKAVESVILAHKSEVMVAKSALKSIITNLEAKLTQSHERVKELAQANKQNKEWKEQNEGLYLLYTKKVLELAQQR